MKNFFTIIIFFFFYLNSNSQIIVSQNSNYCSSDNVFLVLTYDQSFNLLKWQVNEGDDWNDITTTNSSEVFWDTISGVFVDTLLIQNVDDNFNLNQYRAIIDTGSIGFYEVVSNVYSFSVYNEFSLDVFSGDETICFNNLPSQLSAPFSSGGEGVYSYQWLADGAPIVGATSSSYQSPSLTTSTSFSVVVSDNCGVITSNSVTVNVLDDLTIGDLNGNQTICYDTSPGILNAPSVNGGEGIYSYQWLADGVPIVGATSSSYQSPSLTTSTSFSVEVYDVCGTIRTNEILVSVLDDLLPGQIVGDTIICFNTSPGLIEMSILPSGATNTSYSYQWQSSLDSQNWNDIDTENNSFIDIGQLTSSSYYRLKIFSALYNCGPKFTNSVFIEVNSPLDAGLLENQNICYGASTNILFFNQPSGGFGPYQFQWQISNDNVDWEDLNSIQNTLTTINHFSDVYYRARVTDICGELYTNSILINVYDSLQAGNILTNDTICYDIELYQVDANYIQPVGGDLNYSYKWYYSTDSLNFNEVSTESILEINGLIDTSFFYVEYTSGSNCGSVNSNILKVTVHDELNPGLISGDTSICHNTIPEILSFVSPSFGGGDTIFNYQWQISSDNINWSNIDLATSQSYQPDQMALSSYFRCEVFSDYWNCGPKHTNSVFIEVFEIFNSGVLKEQDTICFNTTPEIIQFEILPSGADGNYSYSWELFEENDWTILNESEINFSPNNLNQTNLYRVLVTSDYGCGSDYNQIQINVYDSIIPGQINEDDTICYNQSPNSLNISNNATGGGNDFNFLWYESNDLENWSSVNNSNASYQPPSLYNSTYYYLEFISNKNCGSVNSNIINIVVNPLPDSSNIIGLTSVCSNSSDVEYVIDNILNPLSFSWYTSLGDFNGSFLNDTVLINFYDGPIDDTLYLQQENLYGCSNIMKLNIEITSDIAPEKGDLIRKPNTNILITNDSTIGINYSWGFTNILNDIDSILTFDDSLRYYQMPHLDTENYYYWVDTYYNQLCSTRSYYIDPPPPTFIEEDSKKLINAYPNPNNGKFKIDSSFEVLEINIMSLNLKNIKTFYDVNIDISDMPDGIYIALVKLKSNKTIITKIIKQ